MIRWFTTFSAAFFLLSFSTFSNNLSLLAMPSDIYTQRPYCKFMCRAIKYKTDTDTQNEITCGDCVWILAVNYLHGVLCVCVAFKIRTVNAFTRINAEPPWLSYTLFKMVLFSFIHSFPRSLCLSFALSMCVLYWFLCSLFHRFKHTRSHSHSVLVFYLRLAILFIASI